jgi:hypothetical protein
MKLKERIYQAATQVNVLSPKMSLFVEADTFHDEGRQYCSYDIARNLQLYRGLRQWHGIRWALCELGRSIELPQGYAEISCEKQELANGSEDKIVQMLLKEILEAIYEPVFGGCSHGFRPERNCHTAVKQLNDAVMRNPVNHVVKVDIHKFFDSVDHIWLLKFLKHRIVDPNILWLVRKFLKTGIMEAGKVQASILGFTHYCGKTRKGSFMMGHKTLKLRLSQKLQNTGNWLKRVRGVLTLKEIIKTVKAKLIGFYNYFGINGNMRCLKQYYQSTIWLIYKWINRRRQKKSKNKKQFFDYLKWNPLPTPRIYHAILY